MSLYGVFETVLVGAAVAAGGLSALRTFAPSTFERLSWWRRATGAQLPMPTSATCRDCTACSGCAGRIEPR